MLREIMVTDINRINERLEAIRLQANKINILQGEIRDIVSAISMSRRK